MARSLSQYLRLRFLAAIEGGMSCHGAALYFGSVRRTRSVGVSGHFSLVRQLPNRAAVTDIRARTKRMAASSGT